MNRDTQEQAIRRLFQQLRQADEEAASPFDATLDVIGRRTEKQPLSLNYLRLAVAAAAIAIVIGGGLFALKRIREQGEISQVASVVAQSHEPEAPKQVEKAIAREAPAAFDKPARRGHPTAKGPGNLLATAEAISNWRSPTEFLLDTPGSSLLKTVPKVGDSIPRFRGTPQFENE
jgi:hypothetical protein